jgi:hypothetical protein
MTRTRTYISERKKEKKGLVKIQDDEKENENFI